MSYRTFKHLLGETSLERKCRFIFGGGILVLVTTSFYWYGQKTEKLVIRPDPPRRPGRLVNPTVVDKHYKSGKFVSRETARMFNQLSTELQGPGRPADLRRLHPQPVQEAKRSGRYRRRRLREERPRPIPQVGRQGVGDRPQEAVHLRRRHVDGRVAHPAGQETEFQYIQAVLFKQECIDCHEAHSYATSPNGKWVEIKPATSPAPR